VHAELDTGIYPKGITITGIRFLSFTGVVRDGFGRNGDRFVSTVFVGSGL
jgi:hypothetical protein